MTEIKTLSPKQEQKKLEEKILEEGIKEFKSKKSKNPFKITYSKIKETSKIIGLYFKEEKYNFKDYLIYISKNKQDPSKAISIHQALSEINKAQTLAFRNKEEAWYDHYREQSTYHKNKAQKLIDEQKSKESKLN